ncbi:MAG: CHAT domain-containing tetratricopeptide repeat protein [Saprospiraceae bacterium]|nr:CHAT domain-containing tetratricopeptide repeat protein [Saprospiraceae bacterium]
MPIWLIVSFSTFLGAVLGQEGQSNFSVGPLETPVWDAESEKIVDERQVCTGALWPASSDEVVRWLLGPTICEEDLAAAEACARKRLSSGQHFGEEYRWRMALAHAMIGLVEFRRERFAEASEAFDVFRRLAVEQFGAASQAAADAEICIGRVSFAQGDDAKALFYYTSAQAHLSTAALSDRPYLVQVWEDMLAACERRADFACACVSAEMLVQCEQRHPAPDTLRWVGALVRASAAYEQMSSVQEAYGLLSRAQALMLAHQESHQCYWTSALLIKARLKASEEVYSEATANILQAQFECEQHSNGSPTPCREVWITAAEIALQQRAFNLAEQYLSRLQRNSEEQTLDALRLAARVVLVQGQLMQERGRLDDAETLWRKQTDVLARIDIALPEEAALLEQLARLHAKKGRLDTAERYGLEALRRYQAVFTQGHSSVLRVYLVLGEVHALKGALSKALQCVELAIPLLQAPAHQTYAGRLLLLEAFEAKARYLLSAYRSSSGTEDALFKAENAVQEGYRLVLHLRQAARSIEQLLALQPRLERLTETGIAVAYEQYICCYDGRLLEEAFEAAQRCQNFIWAPISAIASDPASNSAMAARKRLYAACLERAIKYRYWLNEATPASSQIALNQVNLLIRANEAYYSILDTLSRLSPALMATLPPVAANQIAAKLSKKEALLNYFVGQEAIYVFIITSKAPLDVVEIALDFPLSERVEALRAAVVARTERMRAFYEPAHDLYLRIFKPAEQRLAGRIESMAIVPHGVLAQAPFEALLTALPRPKRADRACDYDYLMHRYAIYYAYSAQHWLSSRTSEKETLKWNRAYVLAPQDERLKKGREEAQSVGRLLGCTLLSHSLSKEQLLDTLRKSQIIHIVGHSLAASNAVFYWKSAPEDSTAHLYASDVLTLPLKTSLVGLSACETASPSYRHPYGLSLARAFSHAGARCVIGADWAIEDAAAQKIMEDFYGLLRKRRTDSKAHALQTAQRNFLSQCESHKGHPYYWAGFRLYGNTLPFERPERRAIRQAARVVRKALKRFKP